MPLIFQSSFGNVLGFSEAFSSGTRNCGKGGKTQLSAANA